MPATVGIVHAESDSSSLAEVGGPGAESMARWLASLPVVCEVLGTPELRTAVYRHAQRLLHADVDPVAADEPVDERPAEQPGPTGSRLTPVTAPGSAIAIRRPGVARSRP